MIRPSRVRKLVPEASAPQIAAFLRLAEGAVKKEGESRQKPAKLPRTLASEEEQEKISLLGDLKSLQGDGKKTTEVDCPTNEKSEFFKNLKKIIPPADGGSQFASIEFTEQFQSKILNLLEAAHPKKEFDTEHFEQVYEKLRKDPMARSKLGSLYAARAHKYGHAHFGSKFWYKESQKISQKLKSQSDRRKFRMG